MLKRLWIPLVTEDGTPEHLLVAAGTGIIGSTEVSWALVDLEPELALRWRLWLVARAAAKRHHEELLPYVAELRPPFPTITPFTIMDVRWGGKTIRFNAPHGTIPEKLPEPPEGAWSALRMFRGFAEAGKAINEQGLASGGPELVANEWKTP